MFKRKKRVIFKKRHFLKMIYTVIDFLLNEFGYTKKPYVIETSLPQNTLMSFSHGYNTYAILYDYSQFKSIFGNDDFETQEAYVACITAHEMRHYYQHRQMLAKKPIEPPKRVALWIKNENNPVKSNEDTLKYYLQPLELDASLFEYVFGVKVFSKVLLLTIKNKTHYKELEKVYEQYFGEVDNTLFNSDVEKVIND